ncbi:MAG TPA: HAMP domain-containing sensor histidine kinase, partial [Polyangiales bacterium]
MSSTDAAFLGQVLRAHDASGELLAARLRVFAASGLLILTLVGISVNSPAASVVLATSALAYVTYALAWLRWRSRATCYEAWVSYVSVGIDVSASYSLALASFLNQSGVYEVYRSPLQWLLLAAANGLTALRGNARVCWFSCGLTLLYGASMLTGVLVTGSAKWVSHIDYTGEGLSLFEAVLANLFSVLPAVIATWVSRRSSQLVIDTAKREQQQDEERAQLEWRLKVADRMVTVGTMAAGVAHEVNNPLTYVLLNLDMVTHRLRAENQLSDVRTYLERAQSGAQRVQAIVASLRTFSRIDEGPEQPVDLRSTLDAALTMASSEVRHRAQVDVDQGESLSVMGSEAKLGQVFLNLIINAAQAITEPDPQRHHIRVRVFREGERAVVEVSDTGCGISPEHLGRIFDPFFTTKPVGSGTGLGLSICHSIVTELSGSIDVRSSPGQGTTFTVRLPLCERPLV